jgi:hypothetical protein
MFKRNRHVSVADEVKSLVLLLVGVVAIFYFFLTYGPR